ncbi:foldase protein PrsA 1 [Paenibacillus montaniterrae]|uniref:Foldase protein PrsA 1 n=1 Tax=Paenibacillus montaniterrae TaxID=429341 RepID=A0A919YW66_9BACL|nr:foldase protein PrsA 1 [Paenibacillus montaniterrae]
MLYNFTTNKRNKWLMLLLSAVLTISLLSACGKDELNPSLAFEDVEGGEVVATYKDGTVTDLEFNKFKSALAFTQGMDPTILDMEGYREYILEQYVVYKVLSGRANQEQQDAAKEDALASWASLEEYLKSVGDVKDQLKTYNLTINDVASFLMMGSAVTKYIDSQITDEMMKTEYDENKADYTLYDIRQIVVNLAVQDPTTGEVTVTRTEEEALARAQEVKEKLEAGGSWDELAKQYSDDTTTKETGGVYTDYMGGRWYEPVKEAAFTQELNKVGEPVLSAVGYHVIQVEGRDILEYESIADTTKDMIRYVLSNQVMDNFMKDELPGYELNITLPPVEGAEQGEGAESGDGGAANEQNGEADGAANDTATDDAANDAGTDASGNAANDSATNETKTDEAAQ